MGFFISAPPLTAANFLRNAAEPEGVKTGTNFPALKNMGWGLAESLSGVL